MKEMSFNSKLNYLNTNYSVFLGNWKTRSYKPSSSCWKRFSSRIPCWSRCSTVREFWLNSCECAKPYLEHHICTVSSGRLKSVRMPATLSAKFGLATGQTSTRLQNPPQETNSSTTCTKWCIRKKLSLSNSTKSLLIYSPLSKRSLRSV